jgi:hypothetical protein
MTIPTPNAAIEARVGEVRGDRLCLRCGFNLHAQIILREPHYGLFIVRCPECSSVTALQEYPVLGRWAKRWGFMLAAAYVLLAVALLLAAGIAAGGFAAAMSMEHHTSVCNDIATRHRMWFDKTGQLQIAISASPSNANLANVTSNYVQNWGSLAAINADWWNTKGREEVLAGRSLWILKFSGEVLAGCIAACAAALAVGAIGAVIMPGLRRTRLLFVPYAVAAIGGVVVVLIPEAVWFRPPAWLPGYVAAGTLAPEVMIPYLKFILLAALIVFITLGMFIGRPIARGLIRLLLPPKYAGAFSFLWECDGRRFRPSSGTTARTPTSPADTADSPRPGS